MDQLVHGLVLLCGWNRQRLAGMCAVIVEKLRVLKLVADFYLLPPLYRW